MKVTLGNLIKIAKEMEAKRELLRQERQQALTITYSLGEEKVIPKRSVAELTGLIEALDVKASRLRALVTLLNVKSKIGFSRLGVELTMGEAVSYLGYMITEVNNWSRYVGMEPLRRERSYGQNAVDFVETTFAKEWAEEHLQSLQAELRNLRTAIDRSNIMVEVEIADQDVTF